MNTLKSATIARDNYYSALAAKIREEYTFRFFRAEAKKAYEQLKADRAKTEAEIKEAAGTYIQSVASQKIAGYKGSHSGLVEAAKIELRQKLKDVIDSKREKLSSYTMTPPPADVLSLLQVMTMRKGNVSEDELNMLIEKTADNYQALCITKDICESKGLHLVLPFNPEEATADLGRVESILSDAINQIDIDSPSYYAVELYCYDAESSKNGLLTSYFKKLDENPALSEAAPELSIKARLEKYRDEKMEAAVADSGTVEDYRNALKADQFLKEHSGDFDTAADKERLNIEKTEAEAKAIMNESV